MPEVRACAVDDVFERLPVGALTSGLRRSVVDKLEHARIPH